MNYTSNMGMNMPDENDKFSIEHFNTNTQALDIVGKPDEYKNTKTYAVGDLCIHNNILYKCIIAVETAEEFNAEKWEVTSLCKEEIANKTAIAELNENFKWKLISEQVVVGGTVNVSGYNEIYVIFGINKSSLYGSSLIQVNVIKNYSNAAIPIGAYDGANYFGILVFNENTITVSNISDARFSFSFYGR